MGKALPLVATMGKKGELFFEIRGKMIERRKQKGGKSAHTSLRPKRGKSPRSSVRYEEKLGAPDGAKKRERKHEGGA